MTKKIVKQVLTLNLSDNNEVDKFLIEKLDNEQGKSTKFKRFTIIGILLTEQLKKRGLELILDPDTLRLGLYQDFDITTVLNELNSSNPNKDKTTEIEKKHKLKEIIR